MRTSLMKKFLLRTKRKRKLGDISKSSTKKELLKEKGKNMYQKEKIRFLNEWYLNQDYEQYSDQEEGTNLKKDILEKIMKKNRQQKQQYGQKQKIALTDQFIKMKKNEKNILKKLIKHEEKQNTL